MLSRSNPPARCLFLHGRFGKSHSPDPTQNRHSGLSQAGRHPLECWQFVYRRETALVREWPLRYARGLGEQFVKGHWNCTFKLYAKNLRDRGRTARLDMSPAQSVGTHLSRRMAEFQHWFKKAERSTGVKRLVTAGRKFRTSEIAWCHRRACLNC